MPQNKLHFETKWLAKNVVVTVVSKQPAGQTEFQAKNLKTGALKTLKQVQIKQ